MKVSINSHGFTRASISGDSGVIAKAICAICGHAGDDGYWDTLDVVTAALRDKDIQETGYFRLDHFIVFIEEC